MPTKANTKISNVELFVLSSSPGPFRLVIDSTNSVTKGTWAQTASIAHEPEDPSVTFTTVDIVQQKTFHDEALYAYFEIQVVEQTFYILKDIHDKEQELITMPYSPITSVDTVSGAVDKFRDLCILTEQQKLESSLTYISYIIYYKLSFFMDASEAWKPPPPQQQQHTRPTQNLKSTSEKSVTNYIKLVHCQFKIENQSSSKFKTRIHRVKQVD